MVKVEKQGGTDELKREARASQDLYAECVAAGRATLAEAEGDSERERVVFWFLGQP